MARGKNVAKEFFVTFSFRTATLEVIANLSQKTQKEGKT
jgi:hypothetical protein